MTPEQTKAEREAAVLAFCADCVWTRSIRTHFSHLFETGKKRQDLLTESANTFFSDLNQILIEHILLQQCKLTDPAQSGGPDKSNLTSNFLLTLEWTAETEAALKEANADLMSFRKKINDPRRKLIAHTDLKARLSLVSLGGFTEADEQGFWEALQKFVSVAHEEAVGGPFELEASMPDGDAASLLHCLADAADYEDTIKEDASFLRARLQKRRYRDV